MFNYSTRTHELLLDLKPPFLPSFLCHVIISIVMWRKEEREKKYAHVDEFHNFSILNNVLLPALMVVTVVGMMMKRCVQKECLCGKMKRDETKKITIAHVHTCMAVHA